MTDFNKIYLQPLNILKGCNHLDGISFKTLKIYLRSEDKILEKIIEAHEFEEYVQGLPNHLKEQAQKAHNNLTSPRLSMLLKSDRKITWDRPLIQGILNVTPDSFSDGGDFVDEKTALEQALSMIQKGAGIIDIGGESTRPGAKPVTPEQELSRVIPIIKTLRNAGVVTPISIDSRNARVMIKALEAGADIINDVSALTHDKASLDVAVKMGVPVILMHASADSLKMQSNPDYDNVLLDIYDYLENRIKICLTAGVKQENIMIDVGIGFGKKLQHNLKLLSNMALFHSLGVPILLGASRKSFISEITQENDPKKRIAGSLCAAQIVLDQGVQTLRVHDVGQTKQMIDVWNAIYNCE